jgi:CHAD domain-containing protein
MSTKAPKPSPFRLMAHLDDLMTKLNEHVPAALDKFEADAVHAARVSTRRMSAAIDLMKPVLSKRHRKPLAEGLRHLRKRLGPLRDADVMIGHLDDRRGQPQTGRAVDWLGERLKADRISLRTASAKDASAKRELRRVAAWPLVRNEINEAKDAVECLLAESLHLQTDAFAEQADRLVEELAARTNAVPQKSDRRPKRKKEAVATEAAEGASDAQGVADATVPVAAPARQNPHDLRIAGKALRYTLEMAAAEGQSPGAGVTKAFKRMQELLGDWHDQVVLADRALAEVLAAELAHHDAAAAERVLDLAKASVRRSAQDLSAFAKLWAEQGAKVAAKIRAAFPLTKAVPDHDASVETIASGGSVDDRGSSGASDPKAVATLEEAADDGLGKVSKATGMDGTGEAAEPAESRPAN